MEANYLVWYSLYFLLLEMLKVKHKIESQTVLESRYKTRRDRISHIFLIIGFLAYMGLNAYALAIYYFVDIDFYENYIKIIVTIMMFIKGCFDIFMHVLFITIFIYFFRLKNARKSRHPSSDGMEISCQ